MEIIIDSETRNAQSMETYNIIPRNPELGQGKSQLNTPYASLSQEYLIEPYSTNVLSL